MEEVAPGITPVADFMPKDAPASHPTPPPDEPLATSEANVETVTTTEDQPMEDEAPKVETYTNPVIEPTASAPPTVLPPAESSLVRPREDDDDDDEGERAAKRSRVEEDDGHDAILADAVPSAEAAPSDVPQVDEISAVPAAEPAALPESAPAATEDQAMETESSDTAPAPAPESAVESATEPAPVKDESTVAEAAVEPEVKPTDQDVKMADSDAKPDVKSDAKVDAKPAEAPQAESQASAQPAAPSSNQAVTQSAPAPPKHTYSTKPITPAQTKFLAEKMKNMKKTKHALSFLHPVDPVALNIPHYHNVITRPMDLTTMETKLKSGQYGAVQDFVDDFNLIIGNTRTFNGNDHPVTQAGLAMEAYFNKMLETVPSSDQPVVQKSHAKKASPRPSSHAARRESRSAAVPAPQAASGAPANPAAAASEAFALQADGTPQIRRESTTNRPARVIKPPPARELTYSKPKRKEHQLELKFCEHVLTELKGPKYSKLNHIFLQPVDPVALNIPHYRQVVKHPMDLSTMTQKLKQGQYGKAAEFKKDFDLMINNCLIFNPHGNPVHDMGIEFQRAFQVLWNSKDRWEAGRKHDARRATSASADDESGDDDEDDDDEQPGAAEGDSASAKTIAQLQKQLLEMQNSLAALGQGPPVMTKKAKSAPKAPGRKAGGGASSTKSKAPASKTKAAPKKVKAVTYEEKQEISEAVGNMNEEQVAKLTKIITENCSKYADQEEMELEIDDLPNDVQALLLKYVRSLFGNPTRGRAASPDDGAAFDDDDFEPPRGRTGYGGGAANKRKKHKPMGKEEQQERINVLQKQLSQFSGGVGAVSASQAGSPAGEDSSDDDSEESEEE